MYLHCAEKHGRDVKKNKTKNRRCQTPTFGLAKMLKNELSEMSNISWSSKTGYNGSNKALFEAISKLDKQDSQKGCGQKSLLL